MPLNIPRLDLSAPSQLNSNLLPGFRSALDVKFAQPAPLDFTPAVTAIQRGMELAQTKKTDEQNFEQNKEKLLLAAKAQQESELTGEVNRKLLMEQAKEAEIRAQLAVPKFQFDVNKFNAEIARDYKKLEVDEETQKNVKEKNTIELFTNYYTLLSKTSDPASQKIITNSFKKVLNKEGIGASEDENGVLKWDKQPEAETQLSKESSQYLGKIKETNDSLNSGRATVANAMLLLDDPKLETDPGAFSKLRMALAGYAKDLGYDTTFIDSANSTSALDAQLNGLILEAGKKMKGSFSDKDIQFLKSASATVGDTKEAIRMKLKFLDDAFAKELDKNNFTARLYKKNPSLVLTESDSLYDQAYNFPRKFLSTDINGNRVMQTFSDFENRMRRKDPELTRGDIIDLWNDAYNISISDPKSRIDFSTNTLSAPVRKYLGKYEE